jgi:hypothetical protein
MRTERLVMDVLRRHLQSFGWLGSLMALEKAPFLAVVTEPVVSFSSANLVSRTGDISLARMGASAYPRVV